MSKITIHEGEQKDLLKAFEDEQWPIADKEHFGDEMPDFTKKKYTVVAEDNGQIVGFIKMETDMGVATINSLLVHADFQRSGIGTELIKKAESQAIDNNCHLIKLETGEGWLAKNFYEKHGYETIAHLKGYYGKRDFVLMQKSILS